MKNASYPLHEQNTSVRMMMRWVEEEKREKNRSVKLKQKVLKIPSCHISACVYRITLHFWRAYLGYDNQGKIFENALQGENAKTHG